jgi:hypothetical protein
VEFLAFLVHTFQVLWAELVSFVGEKPLVAALVSAALLAAVAVPELRHYRNEATR